MGETGVAKSREFVSRTHTQPERARPTSTKENPIVKSKWIFSISIRRRIKRSTKSTTTEPDDLLLAHSYTATMTAKEPPAKKAKKEAKGKKGAEKEEEVPAEKAKKTDAADWKDHKLNIENAIDKAHEGCSFHELAKSNIQVLQGIGPKSDAILEAMKLETVHDLAHYKYYKMAHAIQTLAAVEGSARMEGSKMNADLALDKEYEQKTFVEILDSPVSALQGLSTAASELLAGIHIKTIKDLANCKYFHWAQAICTIADFEEELTTSARKSARAAKKLS
jgi:predicted flap endonuclease-1-like 5' DNA nuclease